MTIRGYDVIFNKEMQRKAKKKKLRIQFLDHYDGHGINTKEKTGWYA